MGKWRGMTDRFSFQIHARQDRARSGVITTRRGEIRTPAFMPVGTAATVKAMMPESVRATGADILLGNTYHLMLRPGTEIINAHGDLHDFMNWQKPILTDSGGFQVYSLAKMRKITEQGVAFKSPVDGSAVFLGPEESMDVQHRLGADIVMIFDECTPYPATEAEARQSMELSLRWAARSKVGHGDSTAALFGIVQGGVYENLRRESAEALIGIGFDGYAIGGLAVGEGQELMFQTLDATTPHLPQDKPRYLMGVGKPGDLVGAVERGVDMFDCVLPTRSGRTDQAFTRRGTVNLRNSRHRSDPRPLDEKCPCPACQDHSRAYLHHLIKAKEILAAMMLTWHNLTYYQALMQQMRTAILQGRMDDMAAAMNSIGAPAILKTCRMGYDGKGQARVLTPSDAPKALADMAGAPAILEGFVPFRREISVIAARGLDGRIEAFDPGENEHEGGILRRTTVPAALSADTHARAMEIAGNILTALNYVGVIGVELFETDDGALLVNEIAPRVHNTGHWTIEACATDQFQQHIRAVAGWPLASPRRHAMAVMTNLIGDDAAEWSSLAAEPGAALHLYGKGEARPGRKMGHVTVVSPLKG